MGEQRCDIEFNMDLNKSIFEISSTTMKDLEPAVHWLTAEKIVIIIFLVLFFIMGIVGWISCIRSLKAEYLADQTDNVNRLDLTMPGEETPLIPRQVRRQEGKSNLRRLIILNNC